MANIVKKVVKRVKTVLVKYAIFLLPTVHNYPLSKIIAEEYQATECVPRAMSIELHATSISKF